MNSFETSQKRMLKAQFGEKAGGKAALLRADLTFVRAALSFRVALKKELSHYRW